jgi:hypothetical protein
MNVFLLVAGAIALVATAVHGAAGELLVVRKLSPEALPSTRLGRARMTKTMIHVTWHITTSAFLAVAVALLLAGSVLDGDVAHAMGLMGAAAATAFAAVAVVVGGAHSPRALLRHGGPAALTAIAALAWLGALWP